MSTTPRFTSEFVDADGTRIHLRRAGSGRPLLFLHGMGSVRGPLPFFDGLARHHEVLWPDHPGFGLSDARPGIDSVADLADHYAAWITRLGLRDLPVIGNSLGGWLAAELALRLPGRLHSLVLLGPGGPTASGVEPVPRPPPVREQMLRHRFQQERFVQAELDPPRTAEEDRLDARNRAEGMRIAGAHAQRDTGLPLRLRDLELPLLLIWGIHDRTSSPLNAAAWQRHRPHTQLLLLEDAAHFPHVERADATLEAIRAFHAQHTAVRAAAAVDGPRGAQPVS